MRWENGDLGVLVYGDEGEKSHPQAVSPAGRLRPFCGPSTPLCELVIKGEDLNRLHIAGRVVETKAKW